ncbi:MAG: biosynthetic arginine decarboxylase [Acidobacteriia bacterium]|nr:biosynthetic arginine decarboxylase [Terriglobia bacterium]
MNKVKQLVESVSNWTIKDSLKLYRIKDWGENYFSVNEKGHITVNPDKGSKKSIDLMHLVDQLQTRGISLPILIRFTEILRNRLKEINQAFLNAIEEFDYQGKYSCIYPVKVNQQRHVVQEILDFGHEYDFGLEAGSKPELLAVLAITQGYDVPIICNGFKDDEFIEMVILAQKIGKNVIPVVERFAELELIVDYANRLEVIPKIGVRVKLASGGAGRWKSSAGYQSKFGLTSTEVLEALNYLSSRKMSKCLNLLHFHLGSQVTDIQKVKRAITESARVYVELIRAGAGLRYLDVGGGLGIDYDGSQSNFESSVNYTLQEYANDIVFRIKSVCDEAGVRHPVIISESGRAVVAYHSVLVFGVLGVSGFDGVHVPQALPNDAPQPLEDLHWISNNLSKKNVLESYHDAVKLHEDTLNLFNLGYLSLEQRSISESLYWHICRRVLEIINNLEYIPDELSNLEELISDTYFCNYSIFQSMPDSWAIRHLFPILPIHRLNEEPMRRATLADITCDSDGRIDRFIDLYDAKSVLPLHSFTGQSYFLASFLVGAYQEILGDLHNLLGDTNAVHISQDEEGEVVIDHVVKGDRVRDVLSYVQYSSDELLASMRKDVELAVRNKKITLEESGRFLRFYESGLQGYTYLEEPHLSPSKNSRRISFMNASPHF